MRINKGLFLEFLEVDFRSRAVSRLKDGSVVWTNGNLAVRNDPNLERFLEPSLADIHIGEVYSLVGMNEIKLQSQHIYDYDEIAKLFDFDVRSGFKLWAPPQKKVSAATRLATPLNLFSQEGAKEPCASVDGAYDYYLNRDEDNDRFLCQRLTTNLRNIIYYVKENNVLGLAPSKK